MPVSDLQHFLSATNQLIISTGDGSHSLYSPLYDETYHSRFGAISESKHIYLNNGLLSIANDHQQIKIFEMGFGTGLLASLTAELQQQNKLNIVYHAIEKHPIEKEIWSQLNFVSLVPPFFSEINQMLWEVEENPWPGFQIKKIAGDVFSLSLTIGFYDLIFYNPFAPVQQPDLWEAPILRKMYDGLQSGGVLVTYSAKSSFRLHLKEIGFEVQKLPGPLGKREMVRAVKP